MPLLTRSNLFGVAISMALAAGFFTPATAMAQAVQTYQDQSQSPWPMPTSPVQAGQMTLKDVLEAHTRQKPQPSQLSATAPLLAPSAAGSSENLMLMQGMQKALHAPGGGGNAQLKSPQLQAPQLQPASAPSPSMPALSSAALAASSPASSSTSPESSSSSTSGAQYEPGREPKNLANGAPYAASDVSSSTSGEVPRATDIDQSPPSLDETGAGGNVAQAMRQMPPPAPDVPLTPAAAMACMPHVETWTKTCAEAGYPSSYAGKINGETRTVCPSGDLQDVWMENSCTPPPETASAVPASTPAASSSSESVASSEQVTAAGDMSSPVSAPAAGGSAPIAPAQPDIEAPAMSTMPLDAGCGTSNGLASNVKPAAALCTSGQSSEVSGEGPWRWQCQGANGGMTVSCAAPVATAPVITTPASSSSASASSATSAVEDGKCGAANGAGTDQAPVAELCLKGAPSHVNGGGPWTWACSGANGGAAAACSASKKADGACGAADGAPTDQMPSADLCSSGFASAVTGNGPWNWTCGGLYGGMAATCSAAPKKDAVCGSASSHGHRDAPADNLCSVGEASAVGGTGPWVWNCAGVNKGATVECTGPASINGTCGGANGVAIAKAPLDDLCATGKASRVTGSGPFTWNCSGIEGGDMQSCTAPMASGSVSVNTSSGTSAVSCGSAAQNASVTTPEKYLCSGGTASAVSGEGPWRWSCSDDAGHSAACATMPATQGLCGTAANVARESMPTDNLCASGMGGKVSSEKGNWTWSCEGGQGGPSVSCTSPRIKSTTTGRAPASASSSAAPATSAPAPITNAEGVEEVACGGAAGQGAAKAPAQDLCSAGKPGVVRGKGPWNWICAKGKLHVSCEAPKLVDAHCGSVNGSIQTAAPGGNLCSSGSPTTVAGAGPWLWTCVGSGGGVSASCSASTQAQNKVDGGCGPAANTPTEIIPSANLCDSGSASTVYGEGPWTWTCSGFNGGIAASCTVRKAVPPAPAPPDPAVNGLCGAANGVAAIVQPMDGLCTSGTTTAISGSGPWNWNCLGQNGGMTVSCTASLVPPAPVTGSCGPANGLPTLTTPRSGLCSAGISSAVNGAGPWTWSCSGTNGGGAVGCVAPLAVSGGVSGGALPSMVTAPASTVPLAAPHAAPVGPVTSVTTAPAHSGLVTPRLPSGPLPPLQTGSMPLPEPSGSFASAPKAAPTPSVTAESISPAFTVPTVAPNLPPDANPLAPPPIRDTMMPAPALSPTVIDANNAPVAGNHFVLDDDVSIISFSHNSENLDNDALAKINKLVGIVQGHSGVRITLTAYAGLDASSSPRDARRLSLARALAIRDYLTSKGVSSSRVDVRALGANVPSGDPDRVDVKAN